MIKELTGLRAIFILLIFFHHCLYLYPGGGSLAVSFFFVASGFSMTLGYHTKVLKSNFNFRQYATRRIIKFYPLHWICLVATLPFMLEAFNWKHLPLFVINATLMQSWFPIQDVYFSFNKVSWFLSDILFFAAVFPLVYRWIDDALKGSRRTVVIVVLIVYMVIAILLPSNFRHAVLYINPLVRLLDFIYGIFLAKVFLQLNEKGKVKTVVGNHRLLAELIIFTLIAFLVVESCVLGKDIRVVSPVYWPLLSVVLIVSSLLGTNGGGLFITKQSHR